MAFVDWSFPRLSATQMTRTAIAVVTITTVFLAGASYYSYRRWFTVPGPGLHRRHSVRRRRRSHLGMPHETEENAGEPSANPEPLLIFHDGETGVNETLRDDWWNDASAVPAQQRAGQNIVTLLFRVSEDNARRNACVHRGCACNACGTVPIRGIRYRCANCADFDLCETCEAQGLHSKTHIFYKVKVPAPAFGPRSMQPVWYPGDPERCLRGLPKALIPKLSKETGFERPELDAFWEQWTFMANTEWRDDPDGLHLAMNKIIFERCLVPSGSYKHAAPNLIHDRMFAFYDTNRDGLISFTEFLHGLSYRKRKDKLRKIFDGYDIDGDGFVSRRDFLRMLRAYYVLYKQMHRDILEGLDDQVMTSSEAQQLVNGRQPLSSLFGREGRVPPGDSSRHLEGKVYERSGEVHITDGSHGAVNEDTHDTAPRDEILSSLFSQERPRMQTLTYELTARPQRDSNPNYLEGLIDPPRQISELPQLLVGEPRPLESQRLQNLFSQVADAASGHGTESDSSEDDGGRRLDANADATNHDGNQPGGSNLTNHHSPNEQVSEGPSTAEVGASGNEHTERPTEGWVQSSRSHEENEIRERLSRAERKKRACARRQLHERWKRRQFYLDEEEGGHAPEDWDSDEDVLGHQNSSNEEPGGESSKSAQRTAMSPRSRSSSKVRFAEDTDDYEIRSNPSTSSRSVPERWGGLEIPEAERDAGKEILYQVTQQAFNELLDVIFKEKESLAVQWAETREERDKWRDYFRNVDLKKEEMKKVNEIKATEDGDDHARRQVEDAPNEQQPEDPFTDSNRSLEELLLAGGYTASVSPENVVANTDAWEESPWPVDEVQNDPAIASNRRVISPHYIERRDPTMPQFRPNTIADIRPQAHFAERAVVVSPDSSQPTSWVQIHQDSSQPSSANAPPVEDESPVLPSERSNSDTDESQKSKSQSSSDPTGLKFHMSKGKDKRSGGKDKGKKPIKKLLYDVSSSASPSSPPDHDTLVEYQRLEHAQREAAERGGWGRLSYDEFEEIYKTQEMNGNRLDYLGSWIDFSIP